MRILLVLLAFAFLPALENANVASAELAPVIAEQDPFRSRIIVRNPYDRAVRIERIDSTCTCTTLKADRVLLLPHGTAELNVEIDNTNKSDTQHIVASVYVTDPDFEPIDVQLYWRVLANVTIDAIPPGQDPKDRPKDRAWRDIVRYLQHERPDELHRLSKRIRLGSDTPPAEGLRILGVDYPGTLWKFSTTDQGNGSWLVTASARDPEEIASEGQRNETVTIRTNHPLKPAIAISLSTFIDRNAGRQAIDPLAPPF
jgi:hypothetical protein